MHIKSTILRCPHAFSCREGGVSTLVHTKSLNLAFGRGDDDETVLKNLSLFADEVGFDPKNVISLPQIHSDRIFHVGKDRCGEGYFKTSGIDSGDGYVTGERGVVLGIKTADCVPILFEAEKNGEVVAVGAVHAGWRGTVQSIAAKCITKLCEEWEVSPSDIRAAIGPCIHACCYTVGEDVFAAVHDGVGEDIAHRHVTRLGEGYVCDLPQINKEIIMRAGVPEQNIEIIDLCTCCRPELFFSHRYSGGVRGTMLNVIFMN